MGPSAGLGVCGKSRPPVLGFDPRTVQPVASRLPTTLSPARNRLVLYGDIIGVFCVNNAKHIHPWSKMHVF